MKAQPKKWTKEDTDYLLEHWGDTSKKSIAKVLGRSVTAIESKSARLGLSDFLHSGEYITFYQLVKILGHEGSYDYFLKRLLKLDFPIKEKQIIKKRYRIVYIKDFWKWSAKHKKDISFAKLEEGILGIEPDWVAEKRRSDKLNPGMMNHNRLWTKAEDEKLIFMCKSCRYTYGDIANELNRTETAVKRRLYDLKVPYRPVPRDNHVKWTDDENKKLMDMHIKGFSNYSIAKALGKTNLSINDRIRKLEEAR